LCAFKFLYVSRKLIYLACLLNIFITFYFRNKNPGCPKDPLFPHNLNHLEVFVCLICYAYLLTPFQK
jgi:hypothetical protein